MAVLIAFTSLRKTKDKENSTTDKTSGMSDCHETCYLKVEDLNPRVDGTERKHSAKSCSVKCCVVALALIVSLTLNIIVSLYLWGYRGNSEAVQHSLYSGDLTSTLHKDSVCTVCSSLGIQTGTDPLVYNDLSVHLIKEGFYLCCMHNAHGLRRLLSLLGERFNSLIPPHKGTGFPQVSRENTGAHLYIDSEALKSRPPVLSWTKEYGFGSAYNSRDIPKDGNQLHITRSGLYKIYSFVTFKTEHHRLRPDNVVHTVNRCNTQLPELGVQVILIHKTTLPEVSERFMTSFLSATVRLREDDQIFVRVSNLSYVYRFAPSNFFGLYYVGE